MSRFIKNLDRGRAGLNEGLPNGLQTMNRYIYGIQKKRYYLLGGESGTGKTTLADYMFLFCPYRYMLNTEGKKIYWTYYSFEQGREAKENSWASKILFDQTGKRLPVAYIMSKGKNRVSDEDYKLLISVNGYLEELFDHINMIDVPIGPKQFFQDMLRYGRLHGKWLMAPALDGNGNPRKNKAGEALQTIVGWEANDPDADHIFMMDHIAYALLEEMTLKLNIDKISRTIVFFRELTNWTFAVIQQFNTELASVERQKFKKNAIAPQRVDFGDSRYTYQDADVVFGMLNPYNYDIPEFHGYNIDRLKGYAIWTFLMKNRHDGPANKAIPNFMDPVAGNFTEIPEPSLPSIVDMLGSDPLESFYDLATEFNESIKLYE